MINFKNFNKQNKSVSENTDSGSAMAPGTQITLKSGHILVYDKNKKTLYIYKDPYTELCALNFTAPEDLTKAQNFLNHIAKNLG